MTSTLLKTFERASELRKARQALEKALKDHSEEFAIADPGDHKVVSEFLFLVKLIDIFDDMAFAGAQGNFDALEYINNKTSELIAQTNNKRNE